MPKEKRMFINMVFGFILTLSLSGVLLLTNNSTIQAQKIAYTATPTPKKAIVIKPEIIKPEIIKPELIKPLVTVAPPVLLATKTPTPVLKTDILKLVTLVPTQSISIKFLAVPVLVSPADGFLSNQSSVTLSWKNVPGASYYKVELTIDPSYTNGYQPFSVSSTSVGVDYNTDSAGNWWWRVQAVAANGATSKWSEIRKVTIDTTPPGVPTLIAPQNGVTVPSPIFSWKIVPEAKGYEFNYQANTTKLVSYTSKVIPWTSYQAPNLKPSIEYLWKVRAEDGAGNWGGWSDQWNVTIK